MNDDHSPDDRRTNDARDIVEGPVGYAHLKDPSTSATNPADLDELPAIDIPDEPAADGRPIDGKAGPGQTGPVGSGRSVDRG